MTTSTEWRTPGKIGDAYMLCPKWFLLSATDLGANAAVLSNVITFRMPGPSIAEPVVLRYGIGALIEDIDCYELHRLEA